MVVTDEEDSHGLQIMNELEKIRLKFSRCAYRDLAYLIKKYSSWTFFLTGSLLIFFFKKELVHVLASSPKKFKFPYFRSGASSPKGPVTKGQAQDSHEFWLDSIF